MPSQEEQPAYTCYQHKMRAILPTSVALLLLSIILYLGILFNISLLDLTGSDETIIKTTSLIVIFFLVVIGISVTIYTALQPYHFYRTKVISTNKELRYSLIKTTAFHRNLFDHPFKTYSIPLAKGFTLRNIPDSTQLQPYINQLIQYANATSSSTSWQSQR